MKTLRNALLGLLLASSLVSGAYAHGPRVGVNIQLGYPVYYDYAPPVYYAPPPVYYTPPPVVFAPAPFVRPYPYGGYYGGYDRGYYRGGHRHWRNHHRD